MTIAYLPIDIDVKLPDEDKVIEFCHAHKIPRLDVKEDTAAYWDIIPVISRISDTDWHDSKMAKFTMNNRYVPDLGKSCYHYNIDKLFPEIPYMLDQLPFQEFTLVSMLLQTKYVPHHLDPHYGDVVPDPYEISIDNEPHRYNIQLTQHGKPGFFVSKENHGEKIFPNITKENPCFAFCERYHWHGSDFVGENKIMLSVFGIVDRVKHKDLIIKNLIKNYHQAIILPDPEDPWNQMHHHD